MSRGLGDVYKRQNKEGKSVAIVYQNATIGAFCLLYTSDAADDTPCVDLGGRRIIKKIFD
ncbi:hypothetical protein JMUB7528_28520 [Staphylococcus aureus]